MLIGNTSFYALRGERLIRTADYNRDGRCPTKAAANEVACWQCTNGEPTCEVIIGDGVARAAARRGMTVQDMIDEADSVR